MGIKWLWIGLGAAVVAFIALLAKALANIGSFMDNEHPDYIDGCE